MLFFTLLKFDLFFLYIYNMIWTSGFPDFDMPEWLGHMQVSADSGKRGYIKPPYSSKGSTNEKAVDEKQGVQKEYRDSEPLVCRQQRRL